MAEYNNGIGTAAKRKIWDFLGLNRGQSHRGQNGQVLQLPSKNPEYLQRENPENMKRKMFYQYRMAKIENVLKELCLQHLLQNFINQDVSVENVPDLSDDDIFKLGVQKIGDKIRLRKLCRDLQNGEDNSKDFYTESQVMDVNMAASSSFQMGDRGNHVTSESIINADRIDSVGQGGAHSRIASSTSTKVSMGTNAKFDAGNKNNRLQSSTKIDAAHLQNVGGNGGFPGIPGVGGPAGNININMGHGASLQGLGSDFSDSINRYHHNGIDERRSGLKVSVYKSTKVRGFTIYEGHTE